MSVRRVTTEPPQVNNNISSTDPSKQQQQQHVCDEHEGMMDTADDYLPLDYEMEARGDLRYRYLIFRYIHSKYSHTISSVFLLLHVMSVIILGSVLVV